MDGDLDASPTSSSGGVHHRSQGALASSRSIAADWCPTNAVPSSRFSPSATAVAASNPALAGPGQPHPGSRRARRTRRRGERQPPARCSAPATLSIPAANLNCRSSGTLPGAVFAMIALPQRPRQGSEVPYRPAYQGPPAISGISDVRAGELLCPALERVSATPGRPGSGPGQLLRPGHCLTRATQAIISRVAPMIEYRGSGE